MFTKALIINLETLLPIPVLFNPPEYQLQKTNQFAEIGIPGLGSSLLQFVRGSAQTLTMELFLDTTDTGLDVRLHSERIVGLTALSPASHAPAKLLFVWGSLVFPCVLESVTQRFEQFNPAGFPLRARLSVTLKGHDLLEDLLAVIPLESSNRVKARIAKAGETLQGIAAEEYGDPRRWRPIADANDVDDPMVIPVGRALMIPTLAS